MKIYIAGPYQPKNCTLHDAARIAQRNTDRAIEVFHALVEMGHMPFCPHLSHYLHTHYSCKRDYWTWWYHYDLTFLEWWAEALFYIAPSAGADMEREVAEKMGLPVFCSLDEIPINPDGIPAGNPDMEPEGIPPEV